MNENPFEEFGAKKTSALDVVEEAIGDAWDL